MIVENFLKTVCDGTILIIGVADPLSQMKEVLWQGHVRRGEINTIPAEIRLMRVKGFTGKMQGVLILV